MKQTPGVAAQNAIFLVLKTQFENIGDALINRELVQLLRAHGRIWVDTSATPRWFIEILELPDDARCVDGNGRLLLAMLRERLRGRRVYFFFLPGGFVGEISPGQFVRRTLLLGLFQLLRGVGVKFCHLGVSYEWIGRRHAVYLRLKQSLMHAFCVRDVRSSRLLQSFHVQTTGVLPDLAFNLADRADRPRGEVRRVCFSFRTDQHPGQFERVHAAVRQVLDRLPADVGCQLAVQVENDRPGMDRLAALLAADAGVEARVVQETRDIELLQEHYTGMDLIVSNRLHVLLLAASAGCHVVACIDDRNEKILGLLESMGREDLLLDMTHMDPVAIERALAAPRLDGRTERNKLREGVARVFHATGTADDGGSA
ncbi:MAG TPA: polysaccharide pyruvyl transferase family protein [Solimonas sp.]|nr:polysaccharide pyruvyl transferase family protein [Solimonas sp.]